ncbi:MAG: transposase [Lachnospiraceae bacterium]|nr:transposase [Lachnospiraceae bacterium]
MSFVANDAGSEQLSLFDSFNTLTAREKRFLDKSWAKYFSEKIFPKIDEKPYAVLYSKKDSRPNTPVNIQIGALLIKEFTNLSDDELLTALMFDIRFQYALHTTSYTEQPLNDRTLGRFRERCATYEKETGIDLLQTTISSLSNEMAEMMKLDFSLKRMDSLMVASNIKRMSRMELLYTCVANLAREVLKKEEKLPESLIHYTEKDDRNRVIYHNKSDETADKIKTILADAKTLKELCGTDYDESSNYQLLLRVIKEQTVEEEDGTLRLRTKEDGGMDSGILQNPADPEATFREKAGKQNRGYVANVTEVSGENGSIVTDYQYEQNTYSDSQFLKDTIEGMGKQEETVTIVTDGAYPSDEARKMAEENNIHLEATNLTGRKAEVILADFEFNEAGTRVTKCPGGYAPKSCSSSNGQCIVSFHRSQCENCPHFKECHPKVNKRTCRKTVSLKSKERATQQRYRSSEEFKKISSFRNGVETIPSILRRKYHIDTMPVRGKLRMKFFFGCKIGALNFKKFCKYMQGLDNCAQNAAIA